MPASTDIAGSFAALDRAARDGTSDTEHTHCGAAIRLKASAAVVPMLLPIGGARVATLPIAGLLRPHHLAVPRLQAGRTPRAFRVARFPTPALDTP